jgi:hypothetical protein
MGEAESTRIRILQKNINDAFVAQVAANQPVKAACPVYSAPILQTGTTPDQTSYTLNKAIVCPLTYENPPNPYACQPVYTSQSPSEPPPGAEPLQGPAIPIVRRKFSRIGGIDTICRVPLDRSSSGRTARLRTGIESSSQFRYVQTVIPRIPYPPYIPPAPNTGVPQAIMSGCNPGTRRVDYSNPKA